MAHISTKAKKFLCIALLIIWSTLHGVPVFGVQPILHISRYKTIWQNNPASYLSRKKVPTSMSEISTFWPSFKSHTDVGSGSICSLLSWN